MPSADADTLEDMLRAALGGDERAYARFLQTVTPLIRGVARARAGGLGPDICEDVVQETLLAIHMKRATWQPERPVRPWIYAIARYKIVDAFRARGRRVQVDISDFAEALPAPPDPDLTMRSDTDRVLSELDPRSARILRAIGVEGAAISEVGRALDMSETAVRVALHRGFRKIAELRRRMVE